MKRVISYMFCLLLLTGVAGAETLPAPTAEAPTEVVQDFVEDDGMSEIVGTADQERPSIEGLAPLYTT